METTIDDADIKRRISYNVNRALYKQGHSRYWLAKQTGDYEGTIAGTCNAKHVPGAGLLARIAKALDVPVDVLLTPIPESEQKEV